MGGGIDGPDMILDTYSMLAEQTKQQCSIEKTSYTVRDEDTATSIAAHFSETAEDLAKANPLLSCGGEDTYECVDDSGKKRSKDMGFIYPGDQVHVPSAKETCLEKGFARAQAYLEAAAKAFEPEEK